MQKNAELEEKLFLILKDFLEEYNPSIRHKPLLTSSLDQDLGIDSLGRIELFHRIESAFKTRFPDEIMFETEYVKDILILLGQEPIQQTQKKGKGNFRETRRSLSKIDSQSFHTLVEAMEVRGQQQPDIPHVYFQDQKGNEITITYGELYKKSQEIANGFKSLGLNKEDTVAIMLPSGPDFFWTFLGIQLAGGIPVPIYPPFRPSQLEEYVTREIHILNNSEIKFLVTFDRAEQLSRLLKNYIPSLKKVIQVKDLQGSTPSSFKEILHSRDSALIQYTSGSTAQPKGVLLNHSSILSNIQSIGDALEVTTSDSTVSWLPLYHDMGLIGCWLGSLYYGLPVTIMSPLSFIARPERWLWAIHEHRATISSAPNFAYELCASKIKDQDIDGLDLSSWRLALNGAEEVHAQTIRKFTERFQPYGFKPEAMFPVYGLAESSVALVFPELNRKPLIDKIKRELFHEKGKAIKAQKGDHSIVEIVSCGRPIPQHQVKIVDDQLNEVKERQVGRLLFKGPSIMQGYYHNPEKTKEVSFDGWIDSADLAYKAEGEIYVTGRIKDLVIKAGRNIYPQEIEEVTNEIQGIRKSNVIAFGVKDEKTGTERLIIVAETRLRRAKEKDQLTLRVVEQVTAKVGIPPDEVVLGPPGIIPKTSSGKLMRSKCKQLYVENKLIKKKVPRQFQVLKVLVKGAWRFSKNLLLQALSYLYGVYICMLTFMIGVPVWGSLLIFPGKINRICCKYAAKVIFFLAGWRVYVEGLETIQESQPVIYIASHMSYLDSILLTAILPSNITFIAKEELVEQPFIRTFIKKPNHILVGRKASIKILSTLERLKGILSKGRSLVIYPEGTFSYANRLRSFKSGAFKVAADTNTPIVPIIIKGTRRIFREMEFPPRWGKIFVSIKPPIYSKGKEWKTVLELRDQAYHLMSTSFKGESID